MGEMIFLRPPAEPASDHPTLAEVSQAMRSLRQLGERFGPYDELLSVQLHASSLRLADLFGDDDWHRKRGD